MNKAYCLGILVLLAMSSAYAQSTEKLLFFRISWSEGKYVIDDVKVILGEVAEVSYEGEYLIKLKDSSGNTLYQTSVRKINMQLEVSEIPDIGDYAVAIDENFAQLTVNYDEVFGTKEGQMFLVVPYVEEASSLVFQHGKIKLAEYPLKKLCNNNGICEQNENYLSCASDCKPDEKDGYCIRFKDDVCDPDCAYGIDPDCEKKHAESRPDIFKLLRDKISYIILFIIIGSIIAYFYFVKKRK